MPEQCENQIDYIKELFDKHLDEIEKEKESTSKLLQGDKIVVMNPEDAERVARKFVRLDAEEAAFKEMVKSKLAEFKSRREGLEYLFKYALEDFTKSNLKGKKKSVKLDTVSLGFRSSPARVKTTDEESLRKWAEVNLPDAFNYDRAPLSITAVSEWEKDNGLAPGREETPPAESFYIKDASKKGGDK